MNQELAWLIKAAQELAPLLEEGWDEYDDSEDQRKGSEACDNLVAAVNAYNKNPLKEFP